MDQLENFADQRLIQGCLYCEGPADSRDHVPSRIFLQPPYPENLPVVGACADCNQSFSLDEQYFACLIEAALVGSTEPGLIQRESIAKTLHRSAALRSRIEAAKTTVNGRVAFKVELDRMKNVVLKLARGHAAYELSQPCRTEPDYFWAGPLALMSEEASEAFNEPHEQKLFGEIGSRATQRLLVLTLPKFSASGQTSSFTTILSEWVEVQEGHYRYLAVDDVDGILIRIVIAECWAAEVRWNPLE